MVAIAAHEPPYTGFEYVERVAAASARAVSDELEHRNNDEAVTAGRVVGLGSLSERERARFRQHRAVR